jgi:hypothetical protein
MGQQLLEDESFDERHDHLKPENDQDVRQDARQGQARAKEQAANVADVLFKTVNHYFPWMNQWFKELTDIRNQALIVYQRQTILWTALLSVVTHRQARMHISHQMRQEGVCENLKTFCGQKNLKNIPHGDTVEYLLARMDPQECEGVQVKMVRRLLRGRVLERYRLQGQYYTVAIDGVHIQSFDYPHCPQCLVQRYDNGVCRWMHMKLQASLVTPTGLCLPMAEEWIENEAHYDKQDCERKAFYRLIKKMREYYPRLPMCVLLDGLYACGPVFDILNKARMQWIVVFKEGTMPETFAWIKRMDRQCQLSESMTTSCKKNIAERHARTHDQRMGRQYLPETTRKVIEQTTYSWMTNVEHWDGKRTFNLMKCRHTQDGQKRCDYTWLVSDGLNLSKDTVIELSEKGGRCRWTIENQGFNEQKNGGYRLEHLYSKDPVSMKIWCSLINIAHIINQLIIHGSLIIRKSFGAVANIAKTMFEHLRYRRLKIPDSRPRIQIRLFWDSS